jgi:hypothetical protein
MAQTLKLTADLAVFPWIRRFTDTPLFPLEDFEVKKKFDASEKILKDS